jgi:LacI family asc operon transcriptional repressor
MVTILDVARMVVSKATVSRALNGKVFVREEVKARILQAVADTGYHQTNWRAILLITKRIRLGWLSPTGCTTARSSQAWFIRRRRAVKVTAVNWCCRRKHSAQDERDAIGLLLELRCEAIMIYPKYLSVSELDDIIDGNQTPIVVINRELIRNRNRCVFTDHRRSSGRWWNICWRRGIPGLHLWRAYVVRRPVNAVYAATAMRCESGYQPRSATGGAGLEHRKRL